MRPPAPRHDPHPESCALGWRPRKLGTLSEALQALGRRMVIGVERMTA
jgi:hypothetical protein